MAIIAKPHRSELPEIKQPEPVMEPEPQENENEHKEEDE